MRIKDHVWLVCLLLGLGVTALHAKGPADYQVGDVVGGDIVTPVALDVIDPAATVALKSSEAAQVPAVFRNCPAETNQVAAQFNAAFEGARSNFISAIQDSFHQATLDEKTVTSEDFGYVITAFNIKNRDFPVTSTLAMDWAYGKGGNFEKKMLLGALVRAVQCQIRPDDVPDGFDLGDVVRLVPSDARKSGPVGLQGRLASKTDLFTITQVRMMFRRAFTGYDEEPLTRVLSAWLKPNCIPDEALTRLAREQATSLLVVTEHYTAGQVIAQQGSVVDAKMKAAFEQLPGKQILGESQPVPGQPVASQPVATDPGTADTVPVVATAQVVPPAPVATPVQEVNAPGQPIKWALPYRREVIELGAISVAAAVICISVLIWKLISRRRGAKPPPTMALQTQVPLAVQTALAPQLVQAVREALVQELAGQRRELLVVQQNAAVEVSRLVRKMDDMQMQLQERLQVYELQIQRLELELAARTEENQELIKLKIEMIRQQRESETVAEHEPEPAFS